jgi:hypothetical protein
VPRVKGAKSIVGQFVLVTWGDAWSRSAEYVGEKQAQEFKPIPCELVGRCLAYTPEGITVAWEKFLEDGGTEIGREPDTEHRGFQFVPKGMIIKIRVLT